MTLVVDLQVKGLVGAAITYHLFKHSSYAFDLTEIDFQAIGFDLSSSSKDASGAKIVKRRILAIYRRLKRLL